MTTLPSTIGQLQNLTELYVDNNQLTTLPDRLFDLTNLTKLSVYNNQLTFPPQEIVDRGSHAIIAYLRDIYTCRKNAKPRYEAKLVLVGYGRAGKSCLVKHLLGLEPKTNEDPTAGIEITPLPPFPHPSLPDTDIQLNAWDFAGQEIEHATHRFFLTDRSLYLVLWKPREGEEMRQVEYWLQTIALHVPGARVLLVPTYADEGIISHLNLREMQNRFTEGSNQGHLYIGNIYPVGNIENQGIEELKKAIAEEAQHLRGMGEPWTPNAIEAENEMMERNQHDITEDEYVNHCVNHKIRPKDARGYRGQYWHDLGKILYFSEDTHLRNLVVLKPNWISKAMSRVMNDTRLLDDKGVLPHSRLPEIWDKQDTHGYRYPPRHHPTFLKLMYKFELGYELQGGTKTLAPHLLPMNSPDEVLSAPTDGTPCVQMTYRFGFMPAGLMSRFIVRTHHYLYKGMHWREGVVLESKDHFAKVVTREDLSQDVVVLEVWGKYPSDFITRLRYELDDILSEYKGENCICEIPCRTQDCKGVFDYKDIIKRRDRRGDDSIVSCLKCDEDFAIKTLLQGLERRYDDTSKQFHIDIHTYKCPAHIVFMPPESSLIQSMRTILQEECDLYFVCENPSHLEMCGNPFRVRQSREWLEKTLPIVQGTVKVIKSLKGNFAKVEWLENEMPLLENFKEFKTTKMPERKLALRGEFSEEMSPRHEVRYGDVLEIPPHHIEQFYQAMSSITKGDWGGLAQVPYEGSSETSRKVLWVCPECYKKMAR